MPELAIVEKKQFLVMNASKVLQKKWGDGSADEEVSADTEGKGRSSQCAGYTAHED